MKRKLYIILCTLASTYLFAEVTPVENTPVNKSSFIQLEQLMNSIDESIFEGQLFTEIDGEFVLIDKNKGEAFVAIENDPFDFQDDMSDVVSTFTNEETTNIDKARIALNAVKDAAKFVQKFDGSTLIDLPIGMSQKFEDTDVTIAINAVRVYPTYTAIEVFVELKRPDWVTPLIFYSPEIKYSQAGGLKGPSKVGLLGDMVVPFEEGKAAVKFKRAVYDPVEKIFTAGTYLQFGCDGFEKLGVDADLLFSREWVVPFNPATNKLNVNGRVFGNFKTELTDLEDWVFDISINNFIIPQCDRIGWNIDNAVFDFSETKSVFNFPLPELAYNPLDDGFLVDIESWKGVKIDMISMQWLDTIAKSTKTSFPSLSGQSIVIDHNGFSGIVRATGLLPLDTGKMDGWAFSIDMLGVSVIMNEASGFEFEGAVVVPILEKNPNNTVDTIYSAINYGAGFDFAERKYTMHAGLATPQTFQMEVFKGEATLLEDSNLTIEYREEGGFGIEATLHGAFTIKEVNVFGKKLSLPTVKFENLAIASQEKYVRNVGQWGISAANGKFMGIAYNMTSMTVDTINGNPLVRVAAGLNFAQKDGIAFSASTAFTVEGLVENTMDSQKYKWETVNVNLINIVADLESVYFFGEIILFKEFPVWGTGFQGKVELYVKGMNKNDQTAAESNTGGTGIGAMALFGTTEDENGEDYRYFLIDVMARLGDGITIPSTGLKLLGMGGGVYYHMNQVSVSQSIEDVAYDPGDPDDVDAFTNYIMDRIGVSLSGTQYVPDNSQLFGVNANIAISLDGDPKIVNANIGLTVQVNSNFGIEFIRLKGIINSMAPVSWTGPSVVGISAVAEFNLLFPGNSQNLAPGFHGTAHFFANISGKAQNVTVVALGGANKYEDIPEAFRTIFENTGQPKAAVKYAGAVEAELTGENFFINAGTPTQRLALYSDLKVIKLDLGAYLDIGTNIPEAPDLPPHIASQLNWTPIPEAARATGNGFAFGANFGITYGGTYTVFTAMLAIESGFDLMLQQYAPAYCDNIPLGVLFFYASGQAYAGLHGEVSGFGFTLFDVGGAAALAFKAPNPSYAKGAVSGYYNVCWGTIKGSCYFPFEVGEKCSSSDDLELDLNLIADLSPSENATNISTDADLTGAVYFPLNEISTMADDDGNPIEYEMSVVKFELLKNGVPVAGELNENDFSVSFTTYELLDEQTDYVLNFEVALKNLTTNQIEFQETKSHFFTTGNHPAKIIRSNVEATWPQDGQFCYYHEGDADNFGYIDLKRDQAYLFQGSNLYYAKITSSFPAAEVARPISYIPSQKRIRFSIPSNLLNGQGYRIQIVSAENNAPLGNQIGGGGPEPVSNYLQYPGGDSIPELREDESLLFTYYFRKSIYDSAMEKYESLELTNLIGNEISVDGEIMEPFGQEEIQGINGKPNSFNIRMNLEETDFYNMYESYETLDGIIHPYQGNSGRSDYSIAIKDNLEESRIVKYGNQNPYRAIDLFQPQTFSVKAALLDTINQLNQIGIVYGLNQTTIDISYRLDLVAYGDIEHFIESSFNNSAYQQVINAVYSLPKPDNCNNIPFFVCCTNSEEYRNDLGAIFQEFHSNENDIFKGAYYFVNDENSCSNILPATINDYDQGFLRTSLPNHTLTSGTYPVYFRYRNPVSDEKIYGPTFNLIRSGNN